MLAKPCVDCIPGSKRVAKYPGPRCFTHHKAKRKATSAKQKGRLLEKRHRMTEEQYQELLEFQGGVCFICHKPPGRKRLAVDHDHALAKLHDHPEEESCPLCWRGLLHNKPCNSFLGWIRDDPDAMRRGAEYLINPPARAIKFRNG